MVKVELKLEDFEVMLSEETIQARVRELGELLNAEYQGRELIVVGVLKGSLLFMSDLVKTLTMPVFCDFLRVSSYEGVHSTGKVRIEFDLTQPIEDKDVLIVEDIIDTGLTADFLLKTLGTRNPRSLKICSLLDKPSRRGVDVPCHFVGFSIQNRFVIGYGLDLDGRYRNLRDVYSLKPEVAKAAGYG